MDFGKVNKSGIAILTWAAMAAFSTSATAAGEEVSTPAPVSAPASIFDLSKLTLEKESFSLGIAYSQVTYKTTHANTFGYTQISDNGAFYPVLELNSSEKILQSWPMRTGSVIIGWDINASASYFNVQDQLINSGFRGQNIGTQVTGGYIGIAPIAFLKMGPLYPERKIYWKTGYGIGPGLFSGSGTAYFNTAQGGTVYNVGSNSSGFALYYNASSQLQVDHWYFDISGKWLQAQDGNHSTLESYGFGFAYRFDW